MVLNIAAFRRKRLSEVVLAPRPGLEPGTCGLTVRRSTNWAIREYTLVPGAGLEPACPLQTRDFKSLVYTISPPGQFLIILLITLVPTPGIELGAYSLQVNCSTKWAKSAKLQHLLLYVIYTYVSRHLMPNMVCKSLKHLKLFSLFVYSKAGKIFTFMPPTSLGSLSHLQAKPILFIICN